MVVEYKNKLKLEYILRKILELHSKNKIEVNFDNEEAETVFGYVEHLIRDIQPIRKQ